MFLILIFLLTIRASDVFLVLSRHEHTNKLSYFYPNHMSTHTVKNLPMDGAVFANECAFDVDTTVYFNFLSYKYSKVDLYGIDPDENIVMVRQNTSFYKLMTDVNHKLYGVGHTGITQIGPNNVTVRYVFGPGYTFVYGAIFVAPLETFFVCILIQGQNEIMAIKNWTLIAKYPIPDYFRIWTMHSDPEGNALYIMALNDKIRAVQLVRLVIANGTLETLMTYSDTRAVFTSTLDNNKIYAVMDGQSARSSFWIVTDLDNLGGYNSTHIPFPGTICCIHKI